MGKSVTMLEHWLFNIKKRYAEIKDAKLPMNTRDQWIQESFHFLRPHIFRCPSRASKVNKKKIHVKAIYSVPDKHNS